MNHIKSYKIFESVNTLTDDINDILEGLGDDGYRFDVNIFPGHIEKYEDLHIFIRKDVSYKWIDVKDYVLHLISYLENDRFEVSSLYRVTGYVPRSIDNIYSIEDDTEINSLELRFSRFNP